MKHIPIKEFGMWINPGSEISIEWEKKSTPEITKIMEQAKVFSNVTGCRFTNRRGRTFSFYEGVEVLFLPLNKPSSLFQASYKDWDEAEAEVREKLEPLLGEHFPYAKYIGVIAGVAREGG